MIKYFLFFAFVLLQGCNKQLVFNDGFESVNENKTFPIGWSFVGPSFRNFKLDSEIKKEGNYCVSIENSKYYSSPQEIENYFLIDQDAEEYKAGSLIELRGFMKTDKVERGYCGIWLKLEGEDTQFLPKIKMSKDCNISPSSKLIMNPNYGDLFTGKILTKSLTQKLKHVLDNRSTELNYWIKRDTNLGFPQFPNEKSYDAMIFPDAGYRLLSLFRYWSIINYYSPYKDVAQRIGTKFWKFLFLNLLLLKMKKIIP